MKRLLKILSLLSLLLFCCSFNKVIKLIDNCGSGYYVTNTTYNATINHIKIIGNSDINGTTVYDAAVNIPAGNNFQTPYVTQRTTTFVKAFFTTNQSLKLTTKMYLNGVLVATNTDGLPSTTHGLTYATSFYCSGVTLELTN